MLYEPFWYGQKVAAALTAALALAAAVAALTTHRARSRRNPEMSSGTPAGR